MLEMIENKFAKYLAVGSFLVTILIIAGPVSDPVNVPKLLALGTLSFALLPYLVYIGKQRLLKDNSVPTYLTLIFILSAISAVIFSQAPLTQNLYGVTGRNTGFVALLSFAILFIISSNFTKTQNIEFVLHSLLAAGVVNIAYGFFEHFIKDPIPWNNNYGAFLGTFGNPNFAGAFMGLIVGLGVVLALSNLKNYKLFFIYTLLVILSSIVVIYTDTTQGVLVAGLTSGFAGGVFLIKTIKNRFISIAYALTFFVTSLTVVLGILQKGPFTQYLYKRSVSLRGVYWDTGINTGNSHPFSGVGLDTFGDWYRAERSLKAATWLPGPETISNSAHNLFIDMYANGGLPLFLSFFSFTVLGFINIVKILRKINNFDPVAVGLIVTFIGFQAQAIISIAQIGIAIWGWILAGLLHAYTRTLYIQTEPEKNQKSNKKKIHSDSPVGVFVFISAAIGLLIAIPPYSADAKYTSAGKSRDLKQIEASLQPNYFNPRSTQTFAMATYLLEQNNFNDLSHKYALEGVKFNPHFYEAWKLLYILKNSTDEERKLALSKMKALDPLNPNLEKLK